MFLYRDASLIASKSKSWGLFSGRTDSGWHPSSSAEALSFLKLQCVGSTTQYFFPTNLSYGENVNNITDGAEKCRSFSTMPSLCSCAKLSSSWHKWSSHLQRVALLINEWYCCRLWWVTWKSVTAWKRRNSTYVTLCFRKCTMFVS